jgi:hypothetical protein
MPFRAAAFPVVLALVLMAWGSGASHAAMSVHKCTVKGAVTYQANPCPESGTQKVLKLHKAPPEPPRAALDGRDTPASLAASSPGLARDDPAVGTDVPRAPVGSTPRLGAERPIASPTPRSPPNGFACDGRTRCAQMTSCEEAYYFLNNCPNVKMDGSRGGRGPGNGVPCERQWCGRQ